MRIAPVILIAGCYTSPPASTTTPLSNNTKPSSDELAVTAAGVGAVRADTETTLVHLRAVLAGYEVKPAHDGSLQYEVWKGAERLFYIVPDDDRGRVFNIHVVSGTVPVAGKSWRVGKPFTDAAHLTSCECWGDNPTCFAKGEHVAVNFNRGCDGLTDGSDPRGRRVLDGVTIQRVIWNPLPFGDDPDAEVRD